MAPSRWLPVALALVVAHGAAAQSGARETFRVADKAEVVLPASVDNSRLPCFPPIIDQRGGSCAQAAGVGYMFTYEVNRLMGRDAASAENRFAYQYAWNFLNGGVDEGGFVEQGLTLARATGMMTEADYGVHPVGEFRWASGFDRYLRALSFRVVRILTFGRDVRLVKRWLFDAGDGSAAGGVVTFSTQSRGWDIVDYSGPRSTGYTALLTRLPTDGSHAMTIVGYDDNVETGGGARGAFIVANTWGEAFASAGRFYLPYALFADTAVGSWQLGESLNAIRVAVHRPLVVFRVRLRYSSRDDLSFALRANRMGAGDGEWHRYPLFRNQGGDHPMRGAGQDGEIELALDYTPHMSAPDDEYASLGLRVIKSAIGREVGSGEVLDVSVVDYRGGEPVEHRYAGSLPKEVEGGENTFIVNVARIVDTSASPFRYVEAGNAATSTFHVATAAGRRGKMRFSNLGERGQRVTIRYKLSK